MESISYIKSIPLTDECDVLVVGGGPAGVCAAVSAARAGARVLLCERYGTLGGMMTAGNVAPLLGSVSDGTMYGEFLDRLSGGGELHAEVTRNGREIPLDRERIKAVLDEWVAEAGVKVWLGAALADTVVRNGSVTGAIFATQAGLRAVRAAVTVDATGDGVAAACAGCAYDLGRGGDGALQPMTIEFLLSGVDESRAISAWGGTDPVRIPAGPFAGMEYRALCRQKNAEGELPANVSIVRLHRTANSGERMVNATQVNGFDPLDPASLALAERELRGQIGQCVAFLKNYIPGYETCTVKNSADTVGVRESRRVRGLESVGDDAVEQGLFRPDAVVHRAWFLIDIHNPTGSGQAEGHSHPAEPYDIPYGALVPASVGGLLVAGRCISGTHRAHASYRVMAICMAVGEAAGAAAALCARNGLRPAELTAAEVRSLLTERGIDLES